MKANYVLMYKPLTQRLRSEAEHIASSRRLNLCQKICLAGCLATQSLPYDKELFNKYVQSGERDILTIFDPLEIKLSNRKGVCTDHGRMAKYLLDILDVVSHTVGLGMKSGPGHFLLSVNLQKQDYLYDSSAGDCSFTSVD